MRMAIHEVQMGNYIVTSQLFVHCHDFHSMLLVQNSSKGYLPNMDDALKAETSTCIVNYKALCLCFDLSGSTQSTAAYLAATHHREPGCL
jgi:hypothetical protein